MQTYVGVQVQLHPSWPRQQMEVSGHLHAPVALLPGKEPLYILDRSWVGPRAGLDAGVEKNLLDPPGTEPRPSSP
jgi:hypothetical protein